jgi:hypothetical protein
MSRFKTALLLGSLGGVLALSPALVAQKSIKDDLKAVDKVTHKLDSVEKADAARKVKAGKVAADKVTKAESVKKAKDGEKSSVDKVPLKDAAGEKAALVAQVKDAQGKDDKIAPRGRLPSNYGKLGISEQQRDRIYAVQAEYNDRIDILLVQIEELREARDAAIDEVLTDGQRQRLKELRAESIKEKASAKKTLTKKPGGE